MLSAQVVPAPKLAVMLAIVSFLTTLATAAPSRAAETDDAATADARTHAERATRFYQVGDYRSALDEYRAAHVAKPDPAFLFDAAQCLRQLGEAAEAVKLYRRFLLLAPDTPMRVQVEKHIRDLEAAATASRPTIQDSTPPTGTPKRTPLIPPPIDAVQTTPERPLRTSNRRWLPWTGAGLSIALAVGAVAAGLSASSRYDNLDKTCGATSAGCSETAIDNVKSRAHLATALWIGAGVAATATGIAFYVGREETIVSVARTF